MWQSGDRVLAKRPSGPHLYPGTVHSQDGPTLHVCFDDGEEARLPATQAARLRVESGDRIEVRLDRTRSYVPAVVRRCDGDRVRIQFDEDAEQEWTSLAQLRIDPAAWKSGPHSPAREWVIGDRVLSQWSGDGLWYPGTIQGVGAEGVLVCYDDDDTEWRALDEVVSLGELRAGARVLCRWEGGAGFYPGRLSRRDGEQIEVHYDDGVTETTTISLVRVQRRVGVTAVIFHPGQRVLAGWSDGRYHPATFERVEGDDLRVRYDEGSNGRVGAENVLPLDLRVGDRIHCRWQGGATHYPGRITRICGDEIDIDYDDGDREKTTVSLVCLTPLDLKANQARR